MKTGICLFTIEDLEEIVAEQEARLKDVAYQKQNGWLKGGDKTAPWASGLRLARADKMRREQG